LQYKLAILDALFISQEFDATWYSYTSPIPLHNKLGSKGKVKLSSQIYLKTY